MLREWQSMYDLLPRYQAVADHSASRHHQAGDRCTRRNAIRRRYNPQRLRRYERRMRPYVEQAQETPARWRESGRTEEQSAHRHGLALS